MERAFHHLLFFNALFTTMVIDAYEGRNTRKFDVLGVYFHARSPKENHVLLKLRGDFSNIMCDKNQ